MNKVLKYIQYVFLPVLFIVNFVRLLQLKNVWRNTVIVTKQDIRNHNAAYDNPKTKEQLIRESIARKNGEM